METMTLQVKKIGEHHGFCREYFKVLNGKQIFAKSTHPVYKDRVEWYTADYNGAEPMAPVKDHIRFMEV